MAPKNENVCLLLVGLQYDYLPGGVMEIPDGDMVLQPIMHLIPQAGLMIVNREWHPEDHFSFKTPGHADYQDGSWPPHCVQGTKGAKIFPAIRKYADYIVSVGTNKHPPDAYSAFVGRTLRPVQDLQEILDRSPIDTIVVAGLALDTWVRYTALDANAIGYNTFVPLDATKAISSAGKLVTLEAFERAHVNVIQSARELSLQSSGSPR